MGGGRKARREHGERKPRERLKPRAQQRAGRAGGRRYAVAAAPAA